MVRRKKDWWKSGKDEPDEDGYYKYNPISEYTNTKKPEDFKPKYELEYPYEWRDSDHNADFHETGKAQFETLAQAMEAKRAGESEEYFTPDYAPYVIKKIKSKVKPKKKPNGITGGQAKAFFKRVNKSTSRTTKSIAKRPKSISKSIAKRPKSISKSIAKKPKSMVKRSKSISKSIAKKPKSISKSIAKRPKSMVKKATRKMRRK
jgi:hypothetical protein